MSVEEGPSPLGGCAAVDPLVSIGVFARRSRLSMKALRLYDRLGLLTPDHVDQDSGYRRYRESQLVTARLVAQLRRLDMPLVQIEQVVSTPGPLAAALIESYWEAVERRIASQRELTAHLRIQLSGGEGSYAMFDIHQREVPEQLVLTEQRHVHAVELPDWLRAAMDRLDKTAQPHGGLAGSWFVVYHGEVDEDSDGPVEVCAPINPAHEASGDVSMRREPAHREAYVRLRKAQVEHPQILSAYDVVEQWIRSRGLTDAGSPREVYFTDFDPAGPADEVCDVAYPIR
ncbi:MAG: MerR family transcriptional regulator [Pseudonocardiaceae bacterium]